MPNNTLMQALSIVYGQDSAALTRQQLRYERAISAFRAAYGEGQTAVFHAPGRLNLIGEHTDYNHGWVMPVALDKDILLVCRQRRDNLVKLANIEAAFTPRAFALSCSIPMAAVGDWVNYAQGAGQWLQQSSSEQLAGLDVLVDGAAPNGTPRGAGLSSSSALTVAMMAALVARNHVPLESAPLAEACSQAEWYVGTRGGIMDHFSSILGQRNAALYLDCRPDDAGQFHYEHVPLPEGYALVIIESGLAHTNTGPYFNRRVAEGRIGVRLLQERYPNITHLRDVDHLPWNELEPLLPEAVDRCELLARGIDPDQVLDNGLSPQTDTFLVRQRCRHVHSENHRVRQSVAALKAGDMEAVGKLLHAAHTSASRDYDISTPEIDTLVDLAEEQPGCLGARLTGAGWGGCVLALVRAEYADIFSQTLPELYLQRTGLQARIFACRSAAGAGLVWEGAI